MLEWIFGKIGGIFLILVGGFLILFFPGVATHQDVAGSDFGKTGILLGIILFFIGVWLVLS